MEPPVNSEHHLMSLSIGHFRELDQPSPEELEHFVFTDLIRFGKFTTASWWDHNPTNKATLTIFPIPARQVTANPNITQNPGY